MSSSARERLLDAARELLRDQGVDGLTIRLVAQRAGVSSATAYTHLGSKDHLFADLFLREIVTWPDGDREGDALQRLQSEFLTLARGFAQAPELADAVNGALLGHDPDVAPLRLRIGAEFIRRIESALGDLASPALVDTLLATFAGALLQAGMGLTTYDQMGGRLTKAAAVILKGHS